MSKYAVDLGLLRCESLKAMLQRGNKFELFLKDTYKDIYSFYGEKEAVNVFYSPVFESR